MCYSATAIANYFITRSKETNTPISNMHLQKMLFFAHAAYFKESKEPLFSDPVVAWQHGPVVVSVYHRLKQYKNGVVNDEIAVLKDDGGKNTFPCSLVIPTVRPKDKEIVDYLNYVWEQLSTVETWRLRALSHAKGGAWYHTLKEHNIDPDNDEDVANNLPRNLTILDSTIMEYGR